MSGGQEKNFSTLGPKLRGNKAQQDYGDKQRQICIEVIDYFVVLLVDITSVDISQIITYQDNLLGTKSNRVMPSN